MGDRRKVIVIVADLELDEDLAGSDLATAVEFVLMRKHVFRDDGLGEVRDLTVYELHPSDLTDGAVFGEITSEARRMLSAASKGEKENMRHCDACEVEGYDGPSGMPGILVAPPFTRLGHRIIERCDACKRYGSDMEAAQAWFKRHGGGCTTAYIGGQNRVVWYPPNVSPYRSPSVDLTTAEASVRSLLERRLGERAGEVPSVVVERIAQDLLDVYASQRKDGRYTLDDVEAAFADAVLMAFETWAHRLWQQSSPAKIEEG
jgi:hypothetical protein